MARVDDIMHAFLDGETSREEEDVLIKELLTRPKLREQFVKSCRLHHATLSAHSPEQAAQFKIRLDLFCRRWESTSKCNVTEFKRAFGAGVVTTAMAASLLFMGGLPIYNVGFKGSAEEGASFAETPRAPVSHVRLVQPATELDGEPLSVTFSVVPVTSRDVDASNLGAGPKLSATFSQAYLKLLREERGLEAPESMSAEDSAAAFARARTADELEALMRAPQFEKLDPEGFSFRAVDY